MDVLQMIFLSSVVHFLLPEPQPPSISVQSSFMDGPIVREALIKTFDCGVHVRVVTMNGTAHHVSTFKLLGCNLQLTPSISTLRSAFFLTTQPLSRGSDIFQCRFALRRHWGSPRKIYLLNFSSKGRVTTCPLCLNGDLCGLGQHWYQQPD